MPTKWVQCVLLPSPPPHPKNKNKRKEGKIKEAPKIGALCIPPQGNRPPGLTQSHPPLNISTTRGPSTASDAREQLKHSGHSDQKTLYLQRVAVFPSLCASLTLYWLWLMKCWFTSTETVGLLETGAHDVHRSSGAV